MKKKTPIVVVMVVTVLVLAVAFAIFNNVVLSWQ